MTSTFVKTTVVLAALFMLGAGGWARLDPVGFAEFTGWPTHQHFLHDAGVFQIGIGLMLLATLWWHDALSVVLAGFAAANTFHAVNHALDRHLGGRDTDAPLMLLLSALALAALVARIRQLRRAPEKPSTTP